MERNTIPKDLDTVFFDAGGVLVVPNMAFVIETLGLSHSVDQLLTAYSRSTDRLSTHATEDERMLWLWEGVFEGLEHDLGESDVADFIGSLERGAWNLWFPATPAPHVHEQLTRLVEAGLQLAVLSNADGTVEDALREAGVCQVGEGDGIRMKAVVDSGVVNMEKPDPRIFHHLIDVAETMPERVVHVGDSLRADMHGARDAGIAGVHLNRSGLCTDDEHYHAKDLRGVVDIILEHVG